jgi:hypothetical protein
LHEPSGRAERTWSLTVPKLTGQRYPARHGIASAQRGLRHPPPPRSIEEYEIPGTVCCSVLRHACSGGSISTPKTIDDPFFHVYQRLLGDNLPSYTLITSDPMFGGETPNVQLPQDVITRIVATVNGSTLASVQTYPELGIAGAGLGPPAACRLPLHARARDLSGQPTGLRAVAARARRRAQEGRGCWPAGPP